VNLEYNNTFKGMISGGFMSYKKTTVSIKYDLKADREPWVCAIKNQDIPLKGKKFTYNLGGLILYVLDHLGHIPYSYVTLKVKEVKKRSKISKERLEKIIEEHEIGKETLDKLVEEHNNARKEYNLTLKLNNVKISRRLKKIEHYLRKGRKEK